MHACFSQKCYGLISTVTTPMFLLYKTGNSLGSTQHMDMAFSTPDRDNDQFSRNCAAEFKGSWWYGSCLACKLTGIYGLNYGKAQGIVWSTFTGSVETGANLAYADLKIRVN